MIIKRANGINESERYLKHLCEQTFLSLWSYPSVYSDEGLSRGQGEEVCDLLVVFENNIIIFSDKDCQFPNTENIAVDWKRWYKKSITKSAKQLWGAEQSIKKRSNHLFLDNLCTQKFPITIPDLSVAKFHLIAVAHNSSERCKQEHGEDGNLRIKTLGQENTNGSINFEETPFCVGDIDTSKTFIHILDDMSFDVLLNHLNTISDFVAYLIKKENLLRSTCSVDAGSELEILFQYHQFINENKERDFLIPDTINKLEPKLIIEKGHWQGLTMTAGYRNKLNADLCSYLWDKIIERTSCFLMKNELYYCYSQSSLGIPYTEEQKQLLECEDTLRFLARENRHHRRVLGWALHELIYSEPPINEIDFVRVRYMQSLFYSDTAYVFMAFPYFGQTTYEEYRKNRREELRNRCFIAKLHIPNARYFIGIATESIFLGKEGRSEDLGYMDMEIWTDENKLEAENLRKELNLGDLQMKRIRDEEYPI
jgi:hypothetical protein